MTAPSVRARAAMLGIVLSLLATLESSAEPDAEPRVGVSPLLVDAAAEVWSVIARPDNPVWPGWDAHATLLAARTRLAEAGAHAAGERLAAFGRGPGVRLVVDYSALPSDRVRLGFTPFGITRVDSSRVIFDQVPIIAQFSDGSELEEQFALPLLRDTRRRELHVRLERAVSREELARLSSGRAPGGTPAAMDLALPGVKLSLKRATVESRPGELRVTLWPEDSR